MENKRVFIFWSKIPIQNYEYLKSLLLQHNWQVLVAKNHLTLKDIINADGIDHKGTTYCLGIIFNDQDSFALFAEDDISYLRYFLNLGNSLFVALGGCRESSFNYHSGARLSLNKILTNYGIRFNTDCVIRPNPYELYHPKEVQLEDFVANKGVGEIFSNFTKKSSQRRVNNLSTMVKNIPSQTDDKSQVVYPNGCTLNVNKKLAIIALTSSRWTLPSCQPICSLYRDEQLGTRIVAIGSASLMSDSYIDIKDNKSLILTLLEFIIDKEFPINLSDAKTIEIAEKNITPNVDKLIDTPIPCLQGSEPLLEDKSQLFDKRLFNIDNSMLPKIIRAYGDLNVSRGNLTLIKPRLNLQSLELEPATHGFILRRTS